MLIEFRFANYRSFRDEQTLSMLAARRDHEHSENLAPWRKEEILRMAGIYGANASGKSNLVQALDAMRELVTSSFDRESLAATVVEPFRLDRESAGQPSLFEAVYEEDEVQHRYGFVAGVQGIHEEWAYVRPGRAWRKWFHRVCDPGTGEVDWGLGNWLRGQMRRLTGLTRPDSLFVPVAAKFNHEQLGRIYRWFKEKLRVLPTPRRLRPITQHYLAHSRGSEGSNGAQDVKQAIVELIAAADVGISDVDVEEKELDTDLLQMVPESLSGDAREQLLRKLKEDYGYEVRTKHRSTDTGEEVAFNLAQESQGTQRLFELAGPWVEAKALDYVVVIDEIEASLHPLLTRKLIEHFCVEDSGASRAQLLFATHDTTLMDPTILRRDQVWFAEKEADGASRLRSLYDYQKPRKGEAIQKGYLAGRYGAVPIFRRFGVASE